MMEITSRQIVAGSLGKLKPKTEDKSQLPKGINLEESPKIKPLALNLCCGIWDDGWAQGLTKAGWDVINVGIEILGALPGFSIQADVREIAKDVEAYFPALKFDLVVASPPCQEYSKRGLPFTIFKGLPPPENDIWEACEKIARELRAPLILENVRNAQKFTSKAKWHVGSFYFWGEMPALWPPIKPRKGFNKTSVGTKGLNRTNWSARGAESGGRQFSSKSKARREWSARAAMIPEELSTWIGECYYPRELRNVKS